MTYRHALRVGEVIRLRWEQLALEERRLQVTRLKKGTPSTHTLSNDEVDALFQLRQEKPGSEFVFVSERNGPLTRRAVHTVIARAAKVAGIPFAVHPFMLRHARGYQLGAKGVSLRTIQSYLGHKNVQHTIAYTPHAGENFDNLDDDTD
jgi:type 1 fimbriae regulatory protein FimB/type 1 fimbriae regulatory protein FimE